MIKPHWFVTGLLAGLLTLVTGSAASAQPGDQTYQGQVEDLVVANAARTHASGQVAAMGHVHLQRPPTHLRMYLQLSGKGKTLEEALAALKERREKVAAQLEKLGADKKVLVFTPPGVDESTAAQQRRMELMIAQRMGRGAKKTAKPVKPPVAVTTMLTATWPLVGDSTEKLLLAADAVREKVKAAELSGDKETPKLSAEEQEVAEEMAAQTNQNMGGDEQVARLGEPRFLYLAQLSLQDRQAALAGAFAKAKAQAAELAKAAGAGLGPMTSLRSDASSMGGFNPYARFGYNPYADRGESEFLQQIAQNGGGDEQQGETLALRPDGISFDFVVNATFAIESAKPKK